jgi:polyvinyl alcohol dehydrogenase (cytochrome)
VNGRAGPIRPSRRAATAVLCAATLATAGCGGGHRSTAAAAELVPSFSPPPAPVATAPPTAAQWVTYQDGPARLGDGPDQPELAPLHQVWNASLDGRAVYGQPLFYDGRVLVATEGDHLYALDAANGAVNWSVDVGTPLTHVQAATGCGDIDPLGITSTPVVDPTTGVVWAVGETSDGGAPPVHHVLVGVQVTTGRVVADEDVDPPDPAEVLHLLQRPALALGSGRIYIGYGGQAGDCGTYHGWLVSVPTSGAVVDPSAPAPGETSFDATPDSTGGAIWGGGAGPAVAPDGDVYVTTGNPNSGGDAPWAESVLELPPALAAAPLASFKDPRATGDLDLSSGTAELLPDGDVFAAGKTEVGYLLSPGLHLTDAIGGVCGSDPDGGAAFDSALDALYLPCRGGGLQQVDLAGDRAGWRAGGVNSTPILVNGVLWALDYGGGTLEEVAPLDGQVLYRAQVGRAVPTFAAPSAVGGLMVVPTVSGVVALAGPSGP